MGIAKRLIEYRFDGLTGPVHDATCGACDRDGATLLAVRTDGLGTAVVVCDSCLFNEGLLCPQCGEALAVDGNIGYAGDLCDRCYREEGR
jgi:hypothetical protein